MRNLASIQKIADVRPIENANAIEKVRINDWWCVAKKDEFKVGDKCVYFEIDSILPENAPEFAFLAKGNSVKTQLVDGKEYRGYRLKTIRLRGQVSQGLALPLSMFATENLDGENVYLEGEDLTESLGIVKYDPPIPAQLAGTVKGNFPERLVKKTDEERVQNLGKLIAEQAGKQFYVTEKLDGCSATYIKQDGELRVCTRNLELKETEGNTLWEIAKRYNFKENLPEGYSVQGEIVGSGIQNNPLKLTGQEFYAFQIYSYELQKYLDFSQFLDVCQALKIQHVPVIGSGFVLNHTVEELLKLADGTSMLNPAVLREGLVFRPLVEQLAEIKGAMQRLSFKVISNEYLLKHE